MLDRGAFVTVLDDWSTGARENLPGSPRLKTATGSVTEAAAVRSAIGDCTVVVHFAGTDILLALRDPVRDCDVNVRGTLNVLTASRDAGTVHRVVYASSDTVYGNPRYLPINEDDALNPLSPFAVSKLAGEHYCKAFYESFGVSTTVLRFANVYGPPNPAGTPPAGAVHHFIEAALQKRPIQVHGDGEQTRDFIFLSDAVDATLQACCLPKAEGQVYNIGTGIETTVNMLANAVKAAAHSESPVRYIQRLDIDNIRRRVLNIEKIRRELRWTPRITLEQGLRLILPRQA
jgi:UDP-glucose 4-epimerase